MEPPHLQGPLAQQFMKRVDVTAIHTDAQVNFDPPNQDIIVEQLTESGPHRLHGQVEGSD